MGWLWGSSEPSPESESHSQQESSSSYAQNDAHPSPPSTDPQPAQERTLDRHEQAFADLKELFSQIDPEFSERASAAVKKRATEEQPRGPDADGFYPSEMKCSQAFDLAYYCSSVGGQLNNVYRFGGLRSCTEQWAQWRFCMRTKAMSEETRREKIREFYQRKAAAYRIGRSSEDVWKARTEPVRNPFAKSVDLYEY